MKKSILLLIAILAAITISATYTDIADAAEYTISPEHRKMLNDIWNRVKPVYINYMNRSLSPDNNDDWQSCALYDIENLTINLLTYAAYTEDYAVINDVAEVYLTAHKYLLKHENDEKYTYRDGYFYWPRNSGSEIGMESHLHSSQFLYAVSSAINIILGLDEQIREDPRYEYMNELVNKYSPIVVDHYYRWLIHGANDDYYGRGALRTYATDRMRDNKAVSDIYMWVVAGIVETLAANNKDPSRVRITTARMNKFRACVYDGNSLFEQRLSSSQLTDFNGNAVTGLNFDLGRRDRWGSYLYTGHTSKSFPRKSDVRQASNVGWDLAHARRFVHVFETLHVNRNITLETFPNDDVMRGLANQFAYGAFNKDLNNPIFTNFMDGTDGWYRAHWNDRKGFGYPPLCGVEKAPLNGGYGFWSKYNPDISLISNTLWDLIKDFHAEDASGNGNYGSIYGGVSWTMWGPRISGKTRTGAFRFTDVGGYVDIPYLPKRIARSHKGSIEAWIKTGKTGQQTIFMHTNMSRDDRYMFFCISQDGYLEFCWRKDTAAFGQKYVSVKGNTKLEANKWYHVVVTSDGSIYRLYVNSIKQTLTGIGDNLGRWFAHFGGSGYSDFIGKYDKSTGPKRFFEGIIDEVRIYNRCLYQAEIREHYQGTFNNDDELVAYLNFDTGRSHQHSRRIFIRNHYGAKYREYKKDETKNFSHYNSGTLLQFLPCLGEFSSE